MNYTDPYTAVPNELKELHQWVLWREETRKGKLTKIPYQISGQKAKANDHTTWTDYQSVCNAHKDKTIQSNGIGFVFTRYDHYCGVDLDNCLDESKKPKHWAKPIVEKLKSVGYGEVSPSGKGIKFWTRAKLPTDSKHKAYLTPKGTIYKSENHDGAIEVYDNGRYFTVTGEGEYTINDGQEVINWLYEQYLKRESNTSQSNAQNKNQLHTPLNLSSNEIIKRIRRSRQCNKFDTLMVGNTSGYPSLSEADLALCSVIAFWTQETAIIDEIFRQSALMRDKWDEIHRGDGATYGQMTIEKALSGLMDTYTTSSRKKRDPIMDMAYRALRRRKF